MLRCALGIIVNISYSNHKLKLTLLNGLTLEFQNLRDSLLKEW